MTKKTKGKIANFFRHVFFFFFRLILTPYVMLVQNVRFKRNGFKVPKSPCLFLSNHQTNWDPIYMEIMFPTRVIHILAHDELFQNPIFNFIAKNFLGAIRRGEGQNDLSAIKKLFDYKKMGRDLCIFPEGDLHIWGRAFPLDDNIAKLVKKLGMSIVFLKIKGAHVRSPRWGTTPRRSKILYEIENVVSPDEVKAMSVPDMHELIIKHVSYNDYAYAWEEGVKVACPFKRAERLEYGLFYCPNCGAVSSLVSDNNTLYCTKCNASALLTRDYHFQSDCETIPDSPVEWADLQQSKIPELCDRVKVGEPIFVSKKIRLYTATRRGFFKKYTVGTAKLYHDRVEHKDRYGYTTVIKYKDTIKMLLAYKGTMDLKSEHVKFRLNRAKPLWSGYTWVQFANYLKENADKYKIVDTEK